MDRHTKLELANRVEQSFFHFRNSQNQGPIQILHGHINMEKCHYFLIMMLASSEIHFLKFPPGGECHYWMTAWVILKMHYLSFLTIDIETFWCSFSTINAVMVWAVITFHEQSILLWEVHDRPRTSTHLPATIWRGHFLLLGGKLCNFSSYLLIVSYDGAILTFGYTLFNSFQGTIRIRNPWVTMALSAVSDCMSANTVSAGTHKCHFLDQSRYESLYPSFLVKVCWFSTGWILVSDNVVVWRVQNVAVLLLFMTLGSLEHRTVYFVVWMPDHAPLLRSIEFQGRCKSVLHGNCLTT
jgi:hypothetical protein